MIFSHHTIIPIPPHTEISSRRAVFSPLPVLRGGDGGGVAGLLPAPSIVALLPPPPPGIIRYMEPFRDGNKLVNRAARRVIRDVSRGNTRHFDVMHAAVTGERETVSIEPDHLIAAGYTADPGQTYIPCRYHAPHEFLTPTATHLRTRDGMWVEMTTARQIKRGCGLCLDGERITVFTVTPPPPKSNTLTVTLVDGRRLEFGMMDRVFVIPRPDMQAMRSEKCSPDDFQIGDLIPVEDYSYNRLPYSVLLRIDSIRDEITVMHNGWKNRKRRAAVTRMDTGARSDRLFSLLIKERVYRPN